MVKTWLLIGIFGATSENAWEKVVPIWSGLHTLLNADEK